MTKNITAVLFALLLSTAAFAQYWGPHPFITPGYQHPIHNQQVNDPLLEETNKTAQAFSGYNGNVPTEVKTRGLMESPIGAFCAWGIECWTSDADIPAVFLPHQNSQYYIVAFPSDRLRVGKFKLRYSLFRIENKPWVSYTYQFTSAVVKGECPKGMTARHARNANEADLCLMTESVKTAQRKEKFKKLFQNNRVTLEMAARALKRK